MSIRYQAASDENKEKYHWGDYQLSKYQIPHYHHCDNNVMAHVVRRITNDIWWVKGLTSKWKHSFILLFQSSLKRNTLWVFVTEWEFDSSFSSKQGILEHMIFFATKSYGYLD